jgi:hypothetical protein
MKLYAIVLATLFGALPIRASAHAPLSILAASDNSSGGSALFASGPQIDDHDMQATAGPEAAPKQFLLLLLGEGLVGAAFFLRRKLHAPQVHSETQGDGFVIGRVRF